MKGYRSLMGVLGGATLLASPRALAKTYQVGPTRTDTTIGAVSGSLQPGDVVEVDGDATYTGGIVLDSAGAAGNPITVRGLRVNGKLPLVSGGANTIEVRADHYVLEGFEITGGTSRCVYHHADDVVMRTLVVHDCPAQGILGADQDSGSLTLEYSEVYASGSGVYDHQIYMATDEVAHPGSVFRMQHCYVHDGAGGNNVKSRAERNEIYYNWLENASFQELELIGPDPNGAQGAWTEDLKREDSDVVGNVLWQKNGYSVVRFGGDGTGQSQGRYRFVSNTVLTQTGGGAVFRLFDGLESVEMHDNVFSVAGGTGLNLLREVEAAWVSGRVVAGQNNWVMTGASNVPPEWTGTITGADPGLTSISTFNLRPAAGSPLIDAGASTFTGPAGHPFPSPLGAATIEPPLRALEAPPALSRVVSGSAIDIGALESTPPTGGSGGAGGGPGSGGTASGGAATSNSGAAAGSGGATATGSGGATATGGGATATGGDATSSGGTTTGAAGSRPDAGSGGPASSSSDKSGCGCRVGAGAARERWGAALSLLCASLLRRRTRRSADSVEGRVEHRS